MSEREENQWLRSLQQVSRKGEEKWEAWFQTHFVDGSLDSSSLNEISMLRIDHARGMVVRLTPKGRTKRFVAELRIFGKGDPEEVPYLEILTSPHKCNIEKILDLWSAWIANGDRVLTEAKAEKLRVPRKLFRSSLS